MAPGTTPDHLGGKWSGRLRPPLNRVARLAHVIALAVGISTMAILTARILLDYTIERDWIQHVWDDFDAMQAMQVHEHLEAKYDDNIVAIWNLWGDDSAMTGIVAVCDIGTIMIGEVNWTIGPDGRSYPHHDRDQCGLGGASLNHRPA